MSSPKTKYPSILQVKFMSMNITTEQKDGQINTVSAEETMNLFLASAGA